jgi:hypothetical protein
MTRIKRALNRRRVKAIIVSLAGPWGNQLRTGSCSGHSRDIENAVSLAFEREASAVQNLLDASDAAERLVRRHTAAWERLAGALLARGRLTGKEAALLFRGPL